jgi:dolichol-phosphate mannosyltransferase
MSLVSVIVPAYNSERTIEEVVRRVQALSMPGHTFELIVVDDASKDGTWERLARFPRITSLRHAHNTGKGGALRTGMQAAQGDVLVIEDDDLEYDPNQIPGLVAPILDGRADVVHGSRQLETRNPRGLRLYYLGGVFINRVIKAVLGHGITDAISGAKALSREAYERVLPIECNGFGVETELTAKFIGAGLRLREVPITYRPRSHAQGKSIHWYHGIALLWALAKYNRRGQHDGRRSVWRASGSSKQPGEADSAASCTDENASLS